VGHEAIEARRLRVADGLDVVLISDDEVLVQFGSRSQPSRLYRDTDLSGVIGRVFARLVRGAASLEDLRRCCPGAAESAEDFAERLVGEGILVDVDRDPVQQYLAYSYSGDTSLDAYRVGVIGAGPLGAGLAECLLGHGVGGVSLYDPRPVDPTWHRYLGGPRAAVDGELEGSGTEPAHQALRSRLLDRTGRGGATSEPHDGARADGHAVEILGAADVESALDVALDRCQVLALCLEQPDVRLGHIVNRACLRSATPWVNCTLDGNLGVSGPVFLPDVTACFNDFRVLFDAATPSRTMASLHRAHADARGAPSFFPGLPSFVSIVSGYVALGVVQFLLTGSGFLLGRAVVHDFGQMTVNAEDVLRMPRCPMCSGQVAAYRPVFSPEVVTRAGDGAG